MAWGLSKTGFNRPNQAEVKIEMETKAKELFGEDINLTLRSPLGISIGLFSWFLAKAYELAEAIYKNGHVSDAEGIHLDYHAVRFSTSRKPEQRAEVELLLTGTPYYTVLAGTRFEREDAVDYALKTDVMFNESGNVLAEAVSLTTGSIGNALPNTITVRSEPTSDIFSVTNPQEAEGGREKETDQELINRLTQSPSNLGSGTVSSIQSAVLSVQGVRSAFVRENNTMVVMADGQREKSFQVFAYGGDGQEIAEAIFGEGAGGIEPYGQRTYVVKDASGTDHYVAFTPAIAVPVFITVSLVTDKTFEASGADQVKQEIINLIEGNMETTATSLGLVIGDDVIRFQIEKVIGRVQGVVDATVYLGKKKDEQTAGNIAIEANQIAVVDADNIVVTVES